MTPPKPNSTPIAQLQQSNAEQRAFELLLIAEQQQTQINGVVSGNGI